VSRGFTTSPNHGERLRTKIGLDQLQPELQPETPLVSTARCAQLGDIRTAADLGPWPCMIGTAELPGYLAS
jgi:hypothetical protein